MKIDMDWEGVAPDLCVGNVLLQSLGQATCFF